MAVRLLHNFLKFQSAQSIITLSTAFLFLSACSGGSSSDQDVSSSLVSLEKISGDTQVTTPNASWAQPMVVRVMSGGEGVPGVPVSFASTSTPAATIVNAVITTDTNGYARSSAISPNVTNAQITVIASIESGPTQTFRLETRSYPDTPTFTLTDPVTLSTAYAQQTTVSATIVDVATAVKWCLSETQVTRPNDGSTACTGGAGPSNGWFLSKPTSFELTSINGVKTVFIWVADQFDQVSLNPSNASIYLDTVAPGIPFVTLSDQGSGSTTDTASATTNLSISNDGDASYWCIVTQMTIDPVPAAPTRTSPCWVGTKPATVLLGALGLNQTYVWLKDLSGNISATYGTNFINFTTLAIADPTLTLDDPNTASTLYARQTTVDLNIGNDALAVKWCVSETQTSRPANSLQPCTGGTGPFNGWLNAKPTSFVLSGGDGAKTVYVWVANSLLNVNSNAVTHTITLDTVAPAIPLADLTDPNTGLPNFTNQATVNLAITGDTDAVRWCVFERSSIASPPSLPAWDNVCWVTPRPTQVNMGALGARRAYVYTKDIAENVSPAPGVGLITYTTTPPSDPVATLRDPDTNSVTLAKNQTVTLSINSPSGTVRWCVSETQTTAPATGTDTCTGGAGPSSGWYTSSPSTFTLSAGEVLKTVYVWVADGANNVNATPSTPTITLDLTAPATPTVSISDPNSGSTTTTNQIIPNLSITGDTHASYWCRIVQDAIDPDPATPTLSDVCWVTVRPTTVVLDTTGTRKLFVFTRDAAGNVGTAGTATIDYSTTAPTDPTISIADATTALTTYAKQVNTNITITNDLDAARWCVSETQTTRPSLGTSSCNGGVGPSSGWSLARPTTWTLSAGDGIKRVYVWTANAANSVNNNSASVAITLDTIIPSNASVVMADPNSGVTTDTNQSTVTLTISGEDSDVTAWCSLEQASISAAPAQPLFNNACWTTSKPLTQVLSALGSRRVYNYFRDRAYNISASAGTATINYSTTAPVTPTLALSDGTTSSTTHIRQVAVATSITGDTGAVKWCVSETQTLRPTYGTSNCLGGAGSANGWFTTRPSSINLSSSDATKTVYLWTADIANNTSASAVTDSIILDTLPPSVPFVTISDTLTGATTVTNATPAILDIQFDTDAIEWCVVEQSFATAPPSQPAWNSGCWVAVRPTTVALGATGMRRAFVFTKDIAHNIGASSGVAQINYTTTPPTDPTLTLTNSSTGSTTITKDLTVTPSIFSPTGTVKWCLSETQTTPPANGSATCTGGTGPSSGWHVSLPSTFALSAGDGLKTVYVWVSDTTNNVNANASTGTMTVDQTPPATPTVVLTDPNSGSTSLTNQFNVTLTITNDTDATKWCPIIQADAAAAPATPDLTDSCWRSSRPTTQLIDATGLRKLYVFTRDAAGNVGSAGTANIDYQILPPADPTITLAESTTALTDYARSQSLTLTITADTNAVKWCVSETQTTRPSLGTTTCTGGTGPSSGWFTVRPTTFTTSAGDGLKRVYVWTADAYNSVNSNASSQTITLDTTLPASPAVTLFDPNTNSSTNTNQATVNMTIGATADALAWCVIEQATASAAPSAPLYNDACWSGSNPTTQALGALGDRKVYVYVRDRAYNVSSAAATATIIRSTTPPANASLALSDPTTSSTTHVRQLAISASITGDTGAVKWCISETQTTQPALGTSTCTGGTGSSNGWYTTRPTSFTLSSSDALKTVYLWTADVSNNTSSGSVTDTITLDTNAPAIPTVSMDDPSTGNTAFTNQASVDLVITGDTDATKWCVFEQDSGAAAPAAPLYNNVCFVTPKPTSVAMGAEGTRRIYVYTLDIANNVSLAPAIASITYSTTAPTDPILVMSNATTGSTNYTNTTSVNISINNPVGAVKWCISETQSTRPANGTTTCTGGAGPSSGWYLSMPSTITLSAGDALKTVYIWVSDVSNNTNANVSSDSITLLQTAPGVPTVVLDDPNTGSTSNTNQNTVDMTITSDAGATAWCSIVQDSALADPTPPTTSDTCWLLTRPTSVALGATGSRKAFVYLRDPAMNISSPGSAIISLSTTAPADPTLDITHNGTGLATYAKTTATNISIGNDATATKWCVSETQTVKPTYGTSTCTGGTGPSNGWFTVRPTTYTLSAGDGLKRVYVWVANISNNVNDLGVNDTIILDTAAPVAFNITGATGGGDTTADAWLGTTVVPTANWDSASGATSYDVVIKNAAGTVDVCALQTTAATAYSFAGCNLTDTVSYRIYVTATDDALNTTTSSNDGFSFTVKLSAPGAFNITGITGAADATLDAYSGSSLPTVSWGASAGVNDYLVVIYANDGSTVMCSQQIKSSVSSSHDYSTTGCAALADNTLFKAEVTSRDVAGNTRVATNAQYSFRTDLSTPSVTITSNPSATSISSAANFVFSTSDVVSGVNRVECKLDAGAYGACTSATTMNYAGLADGAHTFTVRVYDNVELTQTASFAWSIDTVAPAAFTISGITGPTDSTVDTILRNDTEVTVTWVDSATADSYEVSILNSDNSVRCSAVTKPAGSTTHTFTGCNIPMAGSYKAKVVAYRGYGTSYDPGAFDFTSSMDTVTAVITAAAATVSSGSGVVIELVGYVNGVQMSANLLAPTFSISAGTSTGTFGSVTYIGSGTYNVTFTGVLSGTAATITASTAYLGGFGSVTTDSVTVNPGTVSAATSIVAVDKGTVLADNTDFVTVTITAKDAAGNNVPGGLAAGAYTGGTSTGTFGAFTETPASSGIYIGSFMGVVAGTATNIRGTVNGVNITLQPTVQVLPGAPTKIAATGPVSGNTHTCTTAYTITLRDFHNNLASAQSNVQVNFGGLAAGNFSMNSDCSTTATDTTIFLGGSTAAPVYVMPRAPFSGNLTFTDDAATLTTGTIAVTITGVLAWLGTTGQHQWGATSGVPSRSNLDGLQDPRGVWVNTSTNMMYVTDSSNHRIVRYNIATGAMTGWVGRVNITDGLTCPTFPTPSANQAAPGWCTGGSSQASGGANWDGMFNTPTDIDGDGTYLYVIDSGNHRIVKINESTGTFVGWYGRIGASVAGMTCASGVPAINSATPDWCSGASSLASAGTNLDGMFNFGGAGGAGMIEVFDDVASGNTLLLALDTNNYRLARMTITATNITWDGWTGRAGATAPTTNGYNTATCATVLANTATTGWCKGGVASQTSTATTPPVSDYDNMYHTPRGLAVVPGNPSIAYFTDVNQGRIIRLNVNTGLMTGWAGRVTNAADNGFFAAGGTNCAGPWNTNTGWCTGGVPTYSGYRSPPAPAPNASSQNGLTTNTLFLETDGTYLYISQNANGTAVIQRMSLADPLNAGAASPLYWVGRLNAQPTAPAACTTTPLGFASPVWCSGGGSRTGFNEGHFYIPQAMFADTVNNKLYTADRFLNKIQIHTLTTGATAGWVGAKANSLPSSWSVNYTPGLTGDYLTLNADLSFANGVYLGGNINNMQGIHHDGTHLYISDSGNSRVKKYVGTTGSFIGWFGRTFFQIPTGGLDADACTSISVNGLTPTWCTGGASQSVSAAGTGELGVPRGLATDSTYLYFIDQNQHRVVRLTKATAGFAGWFGRNNSGTGLTGFDVFSNAQCPTVSGTAAFTGAWCSSGNHTSSANNDGSMNNPRDIAIDETNGYLFVADTNNHRVNMYSSAGVYYGSLGRRNTAFTNAGNTSGTADATCIAYTAAQSSGYWCKGGTMQSGNLNTQNFSAFNAPQGVSYENGNLYVADTSNHKIHKFVSTTGTYKGWIGRQNTSLPTSAGSGSTLADATCTGMTAGNGTPGWCNNGGSQASGGAIYDNAFNLPIAVWADPNANYIYVVDYNNHRVTKHNKTTGAFVGWRGMIATTPTGGDAGCSVAAADTVTPGWCTGGSPRSSRTLGGFYFPSSITGDTSFIYVTDTLNNRIVAIPK